MRLAYLRVSVICPRDVGIGLEDAALTPEMKRHGLLELYPRVCPSPVTCKVDLWRRGGVERGDYGRERRVDAVVAHYSKGSASPFAFLSLVLIFFRVVSVL